jgi:hypothetical protein
LATDSYCTFESLLRHTPTTVNQSTKQPIVRFSQQHIVKRTVKKQLPLGSQQNNGLPRFRPSKATYFPVSF